MSAFDDWFRQYKKSDRWNLSTVSQSREDAFNAGLAEVERQKEIVLRQTKLNTEVIRERDRLREALETILEIDWTRPGQGGVVTDIAQEALTSQANMSGRIELDRLREAVTALVNAVDEYCNNDYPIHDGDRPLLEAYETYLEQTLDAKNPDEYEPIR